jgi:hydroxymethylglutaryl-CoA reductase
MSQNSRISGFFRFGVAERRQRLAAACELDESALAALDGGLGTDEADHLIENVVGTFALPLGIATNFRINGRDYLVPMAIEEPSVVAAASNAAKIVREHGGFEADADPPEMIAQVQLTDVPDAQAALARIQAARAEILALADRIQPRLHERGGGARDLEVRTLGEGMLAVHVLVDCRDAMGANLLNTVAEAVADRLAELAGGRVGLRILSNLADRRRVRVRCQIATRQLALPDFDGAEVAAGIVCATRFAELDPYRATTHNKGILNGVDAVVVATANDWRSVEAGAHAFAARSGRYGPLSHWRLEGETLCGVLELPLALGIVGGALRTHAGARLALRLLGVKSAQELALVAGAAGLATNLAALRALATEGIQRGHMELHARSVARVEPERAQAILSGLGQTPGTTLIGGGSG